MQYMRTSLESSEKAVIRMSQSIELLHEQRQQPKASGEVPSLSTIPQYKEFVPRGVSGSTLPLVSDTNGRLFRESEVSKIMKSERT